jgi:hypothetical protein
MENVLVKNTLTGAVLAVLLYLAVFGIPVRVTPPTRQLSLQDCGLIPSVFYQAFPNMNWGQYQAECKKLRQERQVAEQKVVERKEAEQKVDPLFQQLLDDTGKDLQKSKQE